MKKPAEPAPVRAEDVAAAIQKAAADAASGAAWHIDERSTDSLCDGLLDFADLTPPGPCRRIMVEAERRLRAAPRADVAQLREDWQIAADNDRGDFKADDTALSTETRAWHAGYRNGLARCSDELHDATTGGKNA